MDKYNSSDFFKMASIKASIDIETYERDMKEKDKELERYKNIIDKAIKYIEAPNRKGFDYIDATYIKNILKGE